MGKVEVLICRAVSQALGHLLENEGVAVISGVRGEAIWQASRPESRPVRLSLQQVMANLRRHQRLQRHLQRLRRHRQLIPAPHRLLPARYDHIERPKHVCPL